MKFEMGSTVKCLITGFEGLVTGRCEYITGCDQYLVQPKVKDGSHVDGKWLDDNRLEKQDVEILKLAVGEKPGACESAPVK